MLGLFNNDLTPADRPGGAGTHALAIILQVFEILVHAVGEEDLTAAGGASGGPSSLHFVHLLTSGHSNLLLLHTLLLLHHLSEASRVALQVRFAFFPLLENDFRHDLPIFGVILLLLLNSALLLLLHHLESLLVRLLDKTVLEPFFELFLSFQVLCLLFKFFIPILPLLYI